MSFISKQLKSQIVLASATPAWTRPANVDAVMLTVVGGGAGGGGGNNATSTTGGGGKIINFNIFTMCLRSSY